MHLAGGVNLLGVKGQSSLEAVIVGGVLLALLLATSIGIIQRNSDVENFSALERDRLECTEIASKIAKIVSTKGYAETIVQGLEKTASVEKGSIVVGSISCRYAGRTWMQTGNATYAADGLDGFLIEQGKTYVLKSLALENMKGAAFCEHGQDWC